MGNQVIKRDRLMAGLFFGNTKGYSFYGIDADVRTSNYASLIELTGFHSTNLSIINVTILWETFTAKRASSTDILGGKAPRP